MTAAAKVVQVQVEENHGGIIFKVWRWQMQVRAYGQTEFKNSGPARGDRGYVEREAARFNELAAEIAAEKARKGA